MKENENSVDSVEANTNDVELKSSLELVINGINYDFTRDCLLKPLEEVLVSKEITSKVETGEKDEDGNELYETKTEVKDIPSMFKKGILLKVPYGFDESQSLFKVGDTVLYYGGTTREFDLFKDSVLIQQFNIVGKVNG